MERNKVQDDKLEEQRRLEGQHEVIMYHIGKAVFAPIEFSKPGLEILDSGCANGRWLRDLKVSSSAKHDYFGTDIEESLYSSPPPKGMHFQNQSINDEFPSDWHDSFDFFHQRLVMAGAAPGTVAPVVDKLVRLLRPGGWLQLIEMNTDPSPDNGSMFQQFIRMLRAISSAVGVGANFAKDIPDVAERASLVQVQQKEFYVACGAAIQDKSFMEKSIASRCSAVARLIQALNSLPNDFKKEDLDGFEGRFRKGLAERGAHSRIVVVWGQKPSN